MMLFTAIFIDAAVFLTAVTMLTFVNRACIEDLNVDIWKVTGQIFGSHQHINVFTLKTVLQPIKCFILGIPLDSALTEACETTITVIKILIRCKYLDTQIMYSVRPVDWQ